MSEPSKPPATREEMMRAVCERDELGECQCIREAIPPCMQIAGIADDILRWREVWRSESYKQGCVAVREVIAPALDSYEQLILRMQRELMAMRGRLGGER